MKDEIGKIPKIKSKEQALKEIIKITENKKQHVLYTDENKWLELKMKVIGVLANRGLNSNG